MTDILLNECGDVDVTEGRLTIVGGVDGIRQRWLIYIRTFLGEWFLDQSIGVPYFQRVLTKGVTEAVLKQVFKDGTLEVPGVIQVISVIVDSLDAATRAAEITVTCRVTGDEGPETGVFKYTGTIPPEGCDIDAPVPATIQLDAQWYWFDPSDLDFIEDQATGSSYVAGDEFLMLNKFDNRVGSALVQGDGVSVVPELKPVINGRTSLDAASDTSEVLAGFGEGGAQVAALRVSTGFTGDFTIFGVYQPTVEPPSEGFDPLMVINGVDDDGTTQRWFNGFVARNGTLLNLGFEQRDTGGLDGEVETGDDGSTLWSDAWAFCAVRSGSDISVWINSTKVESDTSFTAVTLEQDGQIAWDQTNDNTGVLFNHNLFHIGDLIGYSTALTDDEVDAVLAYLIEKWGL